MNQGQIQTWPWFTSTLWNRLRWSQRGSSKLLKRRSQAGPTTSWPTYWAVAFPVGRPHSSQESSLGKGYGGSVRKGKQEKRNKNKHQKKQQDEKINKRARKRRTAVKILKEKETERGRKKAELSAISWVLQDSYQTRREQGAKAAVKHVSLFLLPFSGEGKREEQGRRNSSSLW